jgi:hypothetical protein
MTQVSGTGRGHTSRPTSSRKLVALVGLLIAVLGGLFVSFAPTAGAATEATVPAITDYATYPQAGLIPDGCNADGAGVLVGVSYTITHDSVDRTVANLSVEQLFIGDTVKMSWTDYTAGCEGIGVSLAVKSTDHNVFVLSDNQHLISYQYCSGTDCGGSGQGFGNLTIHVPSKQAACNFQFDAVIGPPLADVGPAGSYYGDFNRQQAGKNSGPNMLIGYSNGGKGECIAPTATASQSCTTEGGPNVDVAIVNPDPNDAATVNVLKDGTVVHSDVVVPIGGEPVHSFVPFDVNEKATVSVVWTDSAGPVDPPKEIFSHEFTFNCVGPSATITHSCASGGVVVDFANNGDSPTTIVVTKNGVTIDTVDLAAHGTATRTYPMAEDETSTFRATGTGYDSGEQTFTHDCVAAESSTTATTEPDTVQGTEIVRSTTLPRTGSGSTLPMSTVAGLLLMTGGLLLALANRPMPTTATANTRSRGR